MAKGKVLKGGWRWSGRSYEKGDTVEAPRTQIMAWQRAGYVRLLVEAPARPVRESAEAAGPRENAAETTRKPPIRNLGGGWYEVAGKKVQGRENAEREAAGG